MPVAPRVFISYSHDDERHEDRVLDLANRLRADGIDAEIDQYETSPPDGWPAWCERQIKKAHFVLMVCTATYLRRVDDEEEPGKGHGVLWEARIIRQLHYDTGSKTAKFVPVLFADGSPEHIPTSVKGAARFNVDKPDEYEALYRLLTNQPRVLKPELGAMRALPPRERRSAVEADPPADGAAGHSRPAAPAAPDAPAEPQSRAEWVFVGREEEREVLAGLLLRPGGRRMPVVVSGMAGVGKTYLVDRVFADNRAEFPGGYVRLSLDPQNLPEVAELLAQIADRLKLPGGGDASTVLARLMDPLTLLHVENVDTPEAGRLTGIWRRRVRRPRWCSAPGCAGWARCPAGGRWRSLLRGR
ncbi:MAG: TIR and AAA domain-containing protein [Defluviicoccus sp.]|nr:MAG: TIR and AAA domain-containing protein [Defluviicoccus sp.]